MVVFVVFGAESLAENEWGGGEEGMGEGLVVESCGDGGGGGIAGGGGGYGGETGGGGAGAGGGDNGGLGLAEEPLDGLTVGLVP